MQAKTRKHKSYGEGNNFFKLEPMRKTSRSQRNVLAARHKPLLKFQAGNIRNIGSLFLSKKIRIYDNLELKSSSPTKT